MSEELQIPVTSEQQSQYLSAGLHLVKITDITQGKPDKNGFPSHVYKFQDKLGAMIEKTLYFSTDRNNPCKAEWIYTKLKAAIGIKANEAVGKSKIVGQKLWLGVKRVDTVDKSGKVVMDNGRAKGFSEVIPTLMMAYTGDGTDLKKPQIDGDPALNNGVPSGVFYETKVGIEKVAPVQAQAESFADEGPDTTQNTTGTPIVNDDF